MSYKVLSQCVTSMTLFAASTSVLGQMVTINSDGEAEAAAAGTMPDAVCLEGDVVVGDTYGGGIIGSAQNIGLAGAAISVGDNLTVGAGGKLITAVDAGDAICGKALTAASADDDYIAFQFAYRGDVATLAGEP